MLDEKEDLLYDFKQLSALRKWEFIVSSQAVCSFWTVGQSAGSDQKAGEPCTAWILKYKQWFY